MLSYYGTILSTIISVLILTITLLYERERTVDDRNYPNRRDAIDKAEIIFLTALSIINPSELAHIYSKCIVSSKENTNWKVDLSKQTSAYLARIESILSECNEAKSNINLYIQDTNELDIVYEQMRKYLKGYSDISKRVYCKSDEGSTLLFEYGFAYDELYAIKTQHERLIEMFQETIKMMRRDCVKIY